MKIINGAKPKIKTYNISHFYVGDVCVGYNNEHYYLVVNSENDKSQLVDLTANKIIRDARNISLLPVDAELKIKSVLV